MRHAGRTSFPPLYFMGDAYYTDVPAHHRRVVTHLTVHYDPERLAWMD